MDNVLQNTIQSQVKEPEVYTGGIDVISMLARAGDLMPPWWSRARDFELSKFLPRVDYVSAAISMFISKCASIPIKIIPKDSTVKSYIKQADYHNSILVDGSDFGGGWHGSLFPRFILSYTTHDNGAFIEVVGDGKPDKERIGPPLGYELLDSSRCQRTGNVIYPVVYTDVTGQRYKLHRSRVIFIADMPSPDARMKGVGFCALTRMISTAQHLLDVTTMEQEELGSRPKRRMIVGKKGITAGEIATAFNEADTQMDNQGMSRYSKSIVVAPRDKRTANTEIDIEVLDLYKALDGADKEKSVTIGMYVIALALNIPPRWIWPASQSGATKADAMYQHVAGTGGGIGYLLQCVRKMLGGDSMAALFGKPIPPYLDVVFDYQDDEQDRAQAEIRELRSKVYTNNLANGVWDIRTARQKALESGDLSEAEFNEMELSAGRLPDGTDILNLFYDMDDEIQSMLARLSPAPSARQF